MESAKLDAAAGTSVHQISPPIFSTNQAKSSISNDMYPVLPNSVEGTKGLRNATPVRQNFVEFAQHKRIMEMKAQHWHVTNINHVKQQSQYASPSNPASMLPPRPVRPKQVFR
uniref:Uncharacterized protein n=1 Tax=Chrysotila carterae TaxID=13221 RepID=A0A7S4C2I3_CHRCT|mmetsp:Transcript_5696/g.12522  ORF Transcript_5696/g.12522 Transcript_5696/m.12522 type:complete len:113 (-) Transcript_5696:220-558(-)